MNAAQHGRDQKEREPRMHANARECEENREWTPAHTAGSTRVVVALLATGLLIVAVGAMIGLAVRKQAAPPAARAIEDIQREEGIPVVVAQAVRTNLVRHLFLDATVEPNVRAPIMANVEQRVLRVYVDEGDEVFAGSSSTLLAELEPSNLKAALAAAKTTFENAQTNAERVKELVENGAAPQQEWDRAQVLRDQARAHLVQLESDLRDTRIYSPINGRVARRLTEPGVVTSKGMVLFEVVDLSRFRIKMQVPARHIERVRRDMECWVTFDAYPGLEGVESRIRNVNPTLDRVTRTLSAMCFVEDPPVTLAPGMHARVRLEQERRDDSLAVPVRAVVQQNGVKGAYVCEKAGTARFRAVRFGLETGDWIEVLSGLDSADRVIVEGRNQVADGSKVRVE